MTKRVNQKLIRSSLRNVGARRLHTVLFSPVASRVEEILNDAAHALDDVSDEFARCKNIKIIFEQWKYQQSETYTDAFIEICLPKVFSPIIRREMIDWRPYEVKREDA